MTKHLTSLALSIATLVVFLLVFAPTNRAQDQRLTLSPLFGDHAVLQRGEPVPVWGTAEPGSEVVATVAGVSARTVADSDGDWQLTFPPVESEGPYTIEVQSAEQAVTTRDIVTGEVWLASGQSNMGLGLARAATAESAIARAHDAKMRFFRVEERRSAVPKRDIEGRWEIVTPRNAPSLSGVGFFFAETLRTELGRPVGIIQSAVGGTTAETWLPLGKIRQVADLGSYVDAWAALEHKYPELQSEPDAVIKSWEDAESSWSQAMSAFRRGEVPDQPQRTAPSPFRDAIATHYNAMIAPLATFPIRGVIWYQGEANARSPEMGRLYTPLFTALIESWRAQWRQSELPFIFVQLPEFQAREGWWWVRDAQRRVAATVPHTAMIVTLGYGDMTDIHPPEKAPIGQALARSALTLAYAQPGPISGPIPTRANFVDREAEVPFIHVGNRLQMRESAVTGFELADDTGTFHPAQAQVVASDRLRVKSDAVTDRATAVRYGFANNPTLTLFNDEGLPASPFIELRANSFPHTADTRPGRFQNAIAAFEEADVRSPPEPGGVLFLGSSSIRMWDVQEAFEAMDPINRGFGGSHLSDCLNLFDRVVTPYRPRVIVLYAGDNDVADGKSADEVAENYHRFSQRVHRELPHSRILFISIKPSLKRWSLASEMMQANARIETMIQADPLADYVDVWNPMLGDEGKPRPELFQPDGLHLSEAGYALWESLTLDAIRSE